MSVDRRKSLSAKTRKSTGALNFKSRTKSANEKDGDNVKEYDAFTTFKYHEEASGDSDEADTVFIFPRNWPEWSDYELNNEDWRNEEALTSLDFFHDPEVVLLPLSQMRILDCWKRPHEAFQSACVLYDDAAPCIDIVSANKHLLDSKCMRWVISSITMVQKLVDDGTFTIEGANAQHTPNGGIPWRPWHHVYSLCKAGDTQHKPLINPSGKYVVRLYYLGCWRKIIVDDTLPFDSKGKMLLPASTINGELWPMLISKALLKIASHTWNKFENTSGFHPITCLTGWICEELTNMEFDNFKLWKMISCLLEEEEELPVKEEEPPAVQKPPESSKKEKKKEKSPKKVKSAKQKAEVPELPKKVPKRTEVVGVLSYWSEKYDASEVVQQIFPKKDQSQEMKITPADARLKAINFPVLFQAYKEKNDSSEMNENDDYMRKKNLQKSKLGEQKCIPESYVKAYSHFFGMKEDTASAPVAEVAPSPPEEVDKNDSKKKGGKKGPKGKKDKSPVGGGKKSGKGKSSAKNPVNMGPMMMDSGKWISFNSLLSLMEGIILVHKPSLFKSHYQKPDYSRLLAPKNLRETEDLDDIDEESELCSEFAGEEKSYIYLDSAEEIDLILGLFMLPTPTNLEDNYSRAFDLMLNACEGSDEEYLNYSSSRRICDTNTSQRKKSKVEPFNEPFHSSEKYFDQWIDCCGDIVYELDGDNERYFLCDRSFLAKDDFMVEINVDEDGGDDDSGESEWECEEYDIKLYRFGETIKKGVECTSLICFDEQRRVSDPLPLDSSHQTFLGKKNILYNVLDMEPQINTYLLTNKLQGSKENSFKTFEDIETFYGHPTMTHQPQSLKNSTYLGIERFTWDRGNADHPEMQFDIVNRRTIHLVLPPGRHIFEMLIRSPTFYSLEIISNVEIFHTISKIDILSFMTEDCAILASRENAFRQKLETLVSSLDNGGFIKARRDLLNSYLPQCYSELQMAEKEFIHKESLFTFIIKLYHVVC
ncbi:uncharacterized protein LOC124159609 [Ischnura elegans]|uniref:uncharacterized protein LOC124159609 n=1 Tax=Ischnura elegans TaxID=197161 RepID=UPI001ED892A8|nr:uncharacterized protein LOC124159609 [Ischnura elegans]